ncbi:MAG: O-methyltransferase, partial [Gammaproteobacteria bacterium]
IYILVRELWHFHGKNMNNTLDIDHYLEKHSTPEPELLQELAAYTEKNVPGAQMLTGRVEGRLLKWLVSLVGAHKVLELGTYTGYSALSMAEALPEEGYVLTCDRNAQVLEIAQRYIDRSEHGHKVRVTQQLIGDLLNTLVEQREQFDFIFIDADKKPNHEYVEYALKLLSPKGMIAVDNTLWAGEVLHPEDTSSKVIAKFNNDLLKHEDIEVLMLPVRDGLTLIRRKI